MFHISFKSLAKNSLLLWPEPVLLGQQAHDLDELLRVVPVRPLEDDLVAASNEAARSLHYFYKFHFRFELIPN